jgi:hypothetical protein
MKYIFLFGHRQQHGKDTCCDILATKLLERQITFKRSFFAKLLKKQVAERYNLNYDLMETDDYKQWCPPHINKKCVTLADGTIKDVSRTVRDILIEEGCKGRELWGNTWANSAYMEILRSKTEIGIISDYRYENEYKSFITSFDAFEQENKEIERPIPIRVLVHRPKGMFKNDGADNELPDIDPVAWDYTIVNEEAKNWKENLEAQVNSMLLKYGV